MSVTRSEARRARKDAPGSGATDAGSPGSGPAGDDDREALRPELVALTVLAVVAGVVLRFVSRSPLWLDEALTVNIARLPLGEIPGALSQDGHPPLYYVLLHGWMAAVGDGDTAVRALSGLIAVAALPLAYLVGVRRGGRALGVTFVAVTALSPFALRYATEARMYSLLVLLVLAGYLVVDDVVRRGRAGVGRLAALAVVAAALLYTHYWTIWFLGAVAVVLLVTGRRSPDPDRRRAAWRALGALAVGGVLFLPWIPTLVHQARSTGTPWSGPVRPTSFVAMTLTDFGGGDFRDAELVGAVVLILVLLGLLGRAVDRRRIELDLGTRPGFRAEGSVVALTALVALAVSYLTWSAYATRYAAVLLPLVLLVAAAGLLVLPGRALRAAALAVVLGLFSLGAVYNVREVRTQAAEVVSALQAEAVPGDVVVFCPDQLGPAVARLAPPDLDLVTYPDLGSPERIDWTDYAARTDAADPGSVAATVLDRAGPDRDVFLVWSNGYATHTEACPALAEALGSVRPQHTLVVEDGERFYEHATLSWFPAPGA